MEKLRLNKKGQTVGLGTVGNVIIAFLTLGLIAIAVFAAGSTIKTSGIVAPGDLGTNYSDVNNTWNNITGATTNFFANTDTLLTILFVVILMGFLGLMIFVVKRFGGGTGNL